MKLLNEQLIQEKLTTTQSLNIQIFPTIDSTSQFLKTKNETNTAIDVCLAEEQTQGRGRFDRQWLSPFGENIYCSIQLMCPLSSTNLNGLSLVIGLALIHSLKKCDIKASIQLKWPNDLIWQEKKLAGILIESQIGKNKEKLQIILGFGLNVNTKFANTLSKVKGCSLYDISGVQYDRNPLVSSLLNHILAYWDIFLARGFLAFQSDWQKVDYLYGKNIQVFQQNKILCGLACGVNELGYLQLQDAQGTMHSLASGETSLRII